MYDWSSETPGFHLVNAAGEPVSGAWLSVADAKVHMKYKADAVSAVHWDGQTVVLAALA